MLHKHFHSLSDVCLSEILNANKGVDARRRSIGVGLKRNFIYLVQCSSDQSTYEGHIHICRKWLLMNQFKFHVEAQKTGDTF